MVSEERTKHIRVLLTTIGFDTHDLGMKLVSVILRDAGMEVICLGKYQMPDQIVNAAIQEGADVIGISCYSSDAVALVSKVLGLLRENDIAYCYFEGRENLILLQSHSQDRKTVGLIS